MSRSPFAVGSVNDLAITLTQPTMYLPLNVQDLDGYFNDVIGAFAGINLGGTNAVLDSGPGLTGLPLLHVLDTANGPVMFNGGTGAPGSFAAFFRFPSLTSGLSVLADLSYAGTPWVFQVSQLSSSSGTLQFVGPEGTQDLATVLSNQDFLVGLSWFTTDTDIVFDVFLDGVDVFSSSVLAGGFATPTQQGVIIGADFNNQNNCELFVQQLSIFFFSSTDEQLKRYNGIVRSGRNLVTL